MAKVNANYEVVYIMDPALGEEAIAAMIEKATGRAPHFIGKPNPVMIRAGLRKIGAHSESAAMIGDRMDTDIVGGMEAGMTTVLVLSGVTTPVIKEQFPYRPDHVFNNVGEIDLQAL